MVDCHEIFMVIFQEIQHLALYTMWYAFFPLMLLFYFFFCNVSNKTLWPPCYAFYS